MRRHQDSREREGDTDTSGGVFREDMSGHLPEREKVCLALYPLQNHNGHLKNRKKKVNSRNLEHHERKYVKRSDGIK